MRASLVLLPLVLAGCTKNQPVLSDRLGELEATPTAREW